MTTVLGNNRRARQTSASTTSTSTTSTSTVPSRTGAVGPSPAAHSNPSGSAGEPRTGSTPTARPWAARYGRRLALTDLIVVAWAAVGTHTVHFGSASTRVSRHPESLLYILLTVAIGLLWVLTLQVGGTREASVVGHGGDEYKRIVRASVVLFGLIAISSYVFGLDLPRAYVLVMMPAGLVALIAGRFIWRRWLHGMRASGQFQSKVLVVGSRATAHELMDSLRRAPLAGYRVVGACVRPPTGRELPGSDEGKTIDGIPVLGDLTNVAEVARRIGADVVAVTATGAYGPHLVRKLGWELESTTIDLVLAPALTNIAGPRIHTAPVAGLPLLHVDRPTYRGANRILKKTFDVVGALVLLLAFSPVLLTLAVAIKISDRGPVFFRQERVGLNGRTFKMIKFRSMVTNAEGLLAELRRSQDAGNDVLFKLRDDPRVTRIGKILRRFSLDELPQLFNVVTGEMSLVGPRPPLAAEVDLYGDDARLRLLVKPGMTGLWQVSGRSNLTWEDTVRLDVYYVENWSITSDLVILWKTAKAVGASSGAY